MGLPEGNRTPFTALILLRSGTKPLPLPSSFFAERECSRPIIYDTTRHNAKLNIMNEDRKGELKSQFEQ